MNSLPPSFSTFNYLLVFQWLLLICLLYFLYYAAKKIKAEKSTFIDEAEFVKYKKISLLIPRWWQSSKKAEGNALEFFRSDTRYDWSCRVEEVNSNLDVKSYADGYLLENKVVLDNSYDSYELTTKAEYLFRDSETLKLVEEFIRYEATGTKNETDRIYLDIVCFRIKNDKNIYHLESISSVLNGCVEGPFFEESLKSLIIS